MPNQRAPGNVQTSISLPKVLHEFAKRKATKTGLENVSAYIRYLLKKNQIEEGDNLHLTLASKNKRRS